MNAPGPTDRFFAEVRQEREIQNLTWCRRPGSWPITEGEKLAVLVEEVGEVAKALNELESKERLRAELVQIAAVACSWGETLYPEEE